MTAFFFMPFDDVFERPVFSAAHHHRARCMPCSSPCGGLFKIAVALFLLPTLVRLGFFLLAMFSAVLTQGLFAFAVVASVSSMLVRSSSAEHISSCPTGPWSCRRRRHSGVDTSSKDSEKEEADPRPRNKLDLSSVQLVSREDTEGALLTLVVAAPGVRAADLSVSSVDRYLHIKGESTKGQETFSIDRRILVPQGADMDAIEATHDTDGTLTLVIKRKVPKRVEVVAGAPSVAAREAAAKGVQPRADPSAATAAPPAAADDGNETPVDLDEWER